MPDNRYHPLAGLGALALLAGCAQPLPPTAGMPPTGRDARVVSDPAIAALQVSPVYRIDQPAGTAAGQHAVGRIDLGQGRIDAAIERFRQALALEPDHVDALNGLAIAYGQQGRFDEAIAVLERAIARESAAAHLFNNLGYAQMRAGRLDEAWQALKRAFGLEPRDARTRENLRLLVAARRAVTPPVARLPEAAPTRPDALVQAEPRLEPDPRPVAFDTVSASAASLTGALTLRPGTGFEVSNGVGVTGLARRTAWQLAARGLPSVRLTDARGFGRQFTELHYRTGFLSDAQVVQRSLPIEVRLVSAPHLHPRIHVRLVVGRDLAGFGVSGQVKLSQISEDETAL